VQLVARLLVASAALAAICAFSGPAAVPAQTTGKTLEASYTSKALEGRLRFAVYLPPGYTQSRARYPVIYFLHGLPASPYAYRGIGFVVQALERANLRAIVVAPQGARDGDSDPEYLDWGPGRNWETAIAFELPRYVDSHYRAIESRRGRAVVGLSAGGYGAVLLALHHLESFSVVESWSGYFHPTNPAGTSALDLGSTAANTRASAHALVSGVRAAFRRDPTYFAFYVGSEDKRFRAENEQLDAELRAAGIPHLFQIYPGAHEQTVWQAHAADWLTLALRHLSEGY
jgi:enterochelin esterase-like enzyme